MKRKTYYYICIILALMLAAASLAGCKGENDQTGDGGDATQSSLTGTTADILQQILDEAIAALGSEMPATISDPVTSETSPGLLGVLQDDFVSYVDEATVATAAIGTFAFQVAVIKCNSEDDAKTINEQIMKGYDSGKWICVFPEQSSTMVSGSYVFLAVGSVSQVGELSAAFNDLAGVGSSQDIFYKGETGGGEAGGGLDIGGGLEIDGGDIEGQ